MKQLKDYTSTELAALTYEEIQDLIDLECAVVGIPLLPGVPEKPDDSHFPQPDLSVYTLPDLLFRSLEDAEKVLKATVGADRIFTTYMSGKGVSGLREDIDPYNPELKIGHKRIYSHSTADVVRLLAAEIQAAKDVYNAAQKEHERISQERGPVAELVNDAWVAAGNLAYDRSQIITQFTRYLELAEGDLKIAMRFLTSSVGSYKLDQHEGLIADLEGIAHSLCTEANS